MKTGAVGSYQVVDRLPQLKQSGPESLAKSFTDNLTKAINKVNDYQVKADQAVTDLAVGRNNRIHETMMAAQEAELSLKMLLQVRNKALEAYREIMRMNF